MEYYFVIPVQIGVVIWTGLDWTGGGVHVTYSKLGRCNSDLTLASSLMVLHQFYSVTKMVSFPGLIHCIGFLTGSVGLSRGE
jgi:hypothetical protein